MPPLSHDPPVGRLFEDYLAKAGTRLRALELTATRTESLGLRDLLAYGASNGMYTSDELTSVVLNGELRKFNPEYLASLARVRAFQNFYKHDRPFATAALALATSLLPKHRAPAYRTLEAQLLLASGQYQRMAELTQSKDGLRHRNELLTDLHNPYTATPFANAIEWLKRFNHPLSALDYEPITIKPGAGFPFDRMAAHVTETPSDTLISVIMTTYRPDRDAILGSVRSILNQSWWNFELIIVDDASPQQYSPVLDEISHLDDRITLVRLNENRGTYVARNRALALAQGVYITGQDDDDWSHPRRLEVQARALDEDPHTPAVRLTSLPAHPNLIRTRIGYGYQGENSSSLMFRALWLEPMGGYLPVRKAADNEFHHRLEAVSKRQVKVIPEPLTVIRVASNSLSRGDYRAGWSHPARRAFRSTYTLWHEQSADLQVKPTAPPPIQVPRRFEIDPRPKDAFDVVFAGDWRNYGGPQRSMLEEIAALRERGLRIGVLHLEAARFMAAAAKPLCQPVQELINSGEVSQVFLDDESAVRLLILRYPPILQFAYAHRSNLAVERLIILANQAPSERDGSDVRYRTADCTHNAIELFGVAPQWVPQSPLIRQILTGLIPRDSLAPFDMPGILKLEDWRINRTAFRSTIPVIGRHSRDNAMKWPGDPATLRKIYPIDGSVDVRIMGGAAAPRKVLKRSFNPGAWLVLEADAIPVRMFLSSIDYFVYYQHEAAYDAFGRATLEALAAGCVAILPPFLEDTFGEAALYAEPKDVMPLVQGLYANPDAHWRQVQKSVQIVSERFDYATYADRVSQVLNSSLPSIRPQR